MMKKITLALMSLTFLFVGFVNSQVILNAPLTAGTVPANWTNLDIDGVPGDVFFTDQGIWSTSEWTPVNFGGTFGAALYSTGEFATAPTTASDWLITPQITLLSSSVLELQLIGFATGCTHEIRLATTLAGATPVPADFGTLITPSIALAGTQVWTDYTFDLTAYANQTVYIAFVNTTVDNVNTNGVKLTGIRNVKVLQPLNDDAQAVAITLGSVDVQSTDYLITDLSYASYPCLGNAAETVTLQVLNNGVNPITSFDFGYQIDDLAAVIENVVPGAAIAPGATYSHTFAATADFLTAGDPLYGLTAWVTIPNEGDFTNDTTFVDFVITPQTHDFNTSGNYEDDFERIDFSVGNLQNFETSWGWTLIDANNDGFTTDITPNIPGSANSGEYTLTCSWNTNGTTPSNDYAFAPCLAMETGVGYKVSVNAACGEDAAGIYAESFRFVRNTSASNVGATILSDNAVTDPSYNNFSKSFIVPATGTYYVGVQINTPADRFFINLDDFKIETFTGSPTAALAVSGQDELNAGTYVEYCDSTITVNNTTSGVYDSVTVNWGDGVTQTFGTGPLSHKYTAFGTYTVTVTAVNVLGSSTATATVDVTAIPAPTVTFGAPLVNGTLVTVSLGSTVGTNVVFSPSCSRVIIDWGDGVIDEVTGTNTATHTYTAGTYTITATVIGNPAATATQVVTITTSISNINFVNALNIFPNPSNDFVNVSFGLATSTDIDLTVYSVDGRVIETRAFANESKVNTTFNTSSLNNGVYILKINTENGISTQKFVVSHN